jgi:hypothetical protein
MNCQLHTLDTLYLVKGKSPWYPLARRLDGTKSQSGHSDEEKTSQFLPGIKPWSSSPVTIMTEQPGNNATSQSLTAKLPNIIRF